MAPLSEAQRELIETPPGRYGCHEEDEVAVWVRDMPRWLEAMPSATAADLPAWGQYCCQAALCMRLAATLRTQPLTGTAGSGRVIANSLLGELRKERAALRAMMEQLGMTPIRRRRAADDNKQAVGDGFDEFCANG